MRDEQQVSRDLSRIYGFPVDAGTKSAGLATIANALNDHDLAKAQMATLLLQLPDPPFLADGALVKSGPGRLAYELVACGLLKADDDWDEKHPRAGAPPNPGWFAPKPGGAGGGASTGEGDAPGRGAASAAALAADTGGLLSEGLPAISIEALATLAGRFSVASAFFGAIFVPSSNSIVDEGPVPGRPDIAYRWARDESTVTFKVLIDGQWRTLTVGTLGADDAFRDPDGEIIARMAGSPGQRPTLVTTGDALDRAETKLLGQDEQTATDTTSEDREPKLCPDPTPEPKSTTSQNSIAYQEYVSNLPYGLAINVGGVNFDGCDPTTGNLLEAKANIDFMFDSNDELIWFLDPESDPTIQMKSQSDAAFAAGRVVIWHAQTEKGFRGLSKLSADNGWSNLFVIYDPN